MPRFQSGDKVKYLHPTSGKWKSGVVHGVRSAETDKGEVLLSYLIDTGNDERVDEFSHDLRSDEVTKRAHAIVADKKNPIDNFIDAVEEVSAHEDLPDSEVVTEKVRQPEQVDVLPANVKAV